MPITLAEYQEFVEQMASPRSISDSESRYLLSAIGLAGEAGEFADLIKKAIFHKDGMDRAHVAIDKAKLISELGDLTWYLAFAASTVGVSLQSVLDGNVEKIKARYKTGRFTEPEFLSKETAKEPIRTIYQKPAAT
jgi:NTP pyrophosphatase (non-canonical NTP hydrolase)